MRIDEYQKNIMGYWGNNETTITTSGNTKEYKLYDWALTQDEIEKEYYKDNNNLMTTIKNTIKKGLLAEPYKTLVKAGLMDINKEWACDAKEFAKEKMLEEYMAKDEFIGDMLEVAKERIDNED